MQRSFNKYSASPFTRHLRNNAVLQLIMALGAAFVIFHFVINVMRVMQYKESEILQSVVSYSTLPALADLKMKLWTVFSYSLFHFTMQTGIAQMGFWALFSNMLWLYCFGSVVQMLIGHKHVIPMFFYCCIMGGVFYLLAQLIPDLAVSPGYYIGGAQAGITGMAVAAVTIAPKYRFYLTPHFSLPMLLVAGIFGVLILLYTGFRGASLSLVIAGGLTGFLYIRLLRSGINLSEWIYGLSGKVERTVTPREDAYKKHGYRRKEVLSGSGSKQSVGQQRVDEILDKINRKGYNSLSKEEKDILLRYSKEN
jgi:membrane associated rhomboid family serine protease